MRFSGNFYYESIRPLAGSAGERYKRYNGGHAFSLPPKYMLRLTVILLIVLGLVMGAPWRGVRGSAAQGPSREQIAVTVAPPTLLADGSPHSVVYVQLVADNGIPRLAAQETEVFLVSSKPLVAQVPDLVRIPAGKSYTVADLTTTSASGKATITAVTMGGASATADVTTMSTVDATLPLHLALFASPGILLAGGQPPGVLSIVLLGTNGRSLSAPENLSVVLISSNPAAARVAAGVTIRKGTHFATAEVEPLAAGSAALSALSPGFVSDFAEIHVLEPGEQPEALVLYLTPPVLRSDGATPTGALIQAVDTKRKPVPFPCVSVHLASSSPATVEVAPLAEVNCSSSAQYAVAELTAKLPGTATVTASATGLRPAAANLAVQGLQPTQLKAYLAPEKTLGIEPTPGFIVIQVLDENGIPFSSHSGIPVRLLRSGQTTQSEPVIPAGQSFVALGLEGQQLAGQAEVWVVNPTLASARLQVTPLTLPIGAQVLASKKPLFPGDQMLIQVRAQAAGAPLRQARLNWTVTNGTLSDATVETDENGEGHVVFMAGNPGDGSVVVTVSKPGYDEAKAQTQVAVVARLQPSGRPRLFGVSVLYLFIAILAGLVAYLAYKFLPRLRRRT